MNDKKVYRSISDLMIAGVCGGLANYFKIDSSIIRIVFVLLALGGGSGVLVYLILWLVIPKENNNGKEVDIEKKVKKFAEEVKNQAKEIKSEVKIKKMEKINFLGIVLVLIGVVAIWNQLSPIIIEWNFFWPVILILVGFLVMFKKINQIYSRQQSKILLII